MGLTLNRDGSATIGWHADGEDWEVKLSGPTLEQLGDLLDAVDEVWDQVEGISSERDRIRDAMGEADDDELRALRKESRELEARGRQLGSERFIAAVRILSDDEKAVEKFAEDPPSWAHSLVGITRLINHFTSVPLDGPASPVDPKQARQQPDTSS